MNTFSTYHPWVILAYFVTVVAVNIIIFDPVLFGICFISQTLFYMYIKGVFTGARFAGQCLLFVAACTVINTLVNHRGMGVLFMLGGLPVTVECVVYGMMTGFLLAGSVLAFGCYHAIMTSEKVMCLFGNFFPIFSLLFSMAIGLVPKIKRDYEKIRENHKLVEHGKVKAGILSALIGLSLEDSMEMGISMKNRGFGQGKRTSICRQRFQGRDGIALALIILFAVAGSACFFQSGTELDVFPYIEYTCDGGGIAAYLIFAVLFHMPMVLNAKEELKWSRIVSKM